MSQGESMQLGAETIALIGMLARSSEGEALSRYLANLKTRNIDICCHTTGDDLLRAQGAIKVLDEIEGTMQRLGNKRG